MTPTAYEQHWSSAFERLEEQRSGEPAWLHAARKGAMVRFVELGFPSRQLEDWRYTNVAPIAKTPFRSAAAPERAPSLPDPEHLPVPLGHDRRLVFVNGRPSPELSSLAGLEPRARVESLARVLTADPGRIEAYLGRLAAPEEQAFVALNTAFLADGALVHLPRDATLDEPIYLAFLSHPGAEASATHPRVLVVAEPGSRASVVEVYVSLAEGVHFTNAVTEIFVGENAQLEHVKLQCEDDAAFHVGTIQARQERASRFVSYSLSFGAALTRTDVNVLLAAEGAECVLNGLYVGTGNQHVDHHTRIDHARPQGTSRELYKGILDGSARGVFNGRIVVRPDAQKTDARQKNDNLLLAPGADVNTKPVLEIHADDVKCSHGSTVGHLDEDALFYLRSRGLPERQARGLLTRGFATGVTREIADPLLRAAVERLVVKRLAATPAGGRTA